MNSSKIINQLKDEYLSILDITEEVALKNAEYIYKYVVAQDDTKTTFSNDTMKPIVKIVEYLNEWDSENAGIMLAYLSPNNQSDNSKEYLAIAENSGYNSENNKPAIIISPITHIEDFGKKSK